MKQNKFTQLQNKLDVIYEPWSAKPARILESPVGYASLRF